jgi:putative transposase
VSNSNKPVIGVDLGIKTLATVSDGRVFENPKATNRYARKLRRAQKALSRKQKGSANRKKAKKKVAKIHYRIACVRNNAIHQMTNAITQNPSVIVIEDLNVNGMMANRRLAKAVGDSAFFEVRRQIEYKAKWRECDVIVANRWFASSKTCSRCGWVNEKLTLSDREFICDSCGHVQDRDLNAACNLAKVAVSYTETQNACGGGNSDNASALSQPADEAGICISTMSNGD